MAESAAPVPDAELRKQRQVIFWRTLAAVFGQSEQARNPEKVNGEIVEGLGLPDLITDPLGGVDSLLQRYPECKADFASLQEVCAATDQPEAPPEDRPLTSADLRRSLAYSKLLLN